MIFLSKITNMCGKKGAKGQLTAEKFLANVSTSTQTGCPGHIFTIKALNPFGYRVSNSVAKRIVLGGEHKGTAQLKIF